MARFDSSLRSSNSSKPWRALAPFAALGLIGLHQGCASNSGTKEAGSGSSSGSSAATGSSQTTGSATGTSGTTVPSGTSSPASGTTAAAGTSSGTSPASGTTAAAGTSSGAGTGSSGTTAAAGTTSGAGSGTASSGTVTPTSGTTAASGTAPTVCPGTATAVENNALPYAVDNDFAATGYEGDYGSITNTGDVNGTACGALSPATPRASAKAACWKVTYVTPGPDAAVGTTGYASVVWQANVQSMGGGTYYNNFGVAPGVIPPAGAKEATLWAKGAVGGETVSFGVGSAMTAPCTDSVAAAAVNVTLTTTWTKYEIPFPAGVTYTAGQVSGFAWAVGAGTPGATTSFYIDNIQWDAN